MDKLCGLFANLEFKNVRSFIQTGNIFFESTQTDVNLLRKKIEQHLMTKLGFNVPECLRTVEQFKEMMSSNPFAKVKVTDDIRLSIVFFAEPAKVDLPVPFIIPDGGYRLVDKTQNELLVVCHIKNGKPANSYGLIEKKVQVPATVRFWHTAGKILATAEHV